jgi:protein tyrosine/serine phosphatase
MDAKAPAAPERILRWDGCVNVRDLGGLPLTDGGETAYRVVVRADSLRRLTEEGKRALTDYGVSLVVDLRSERARDEAPLPIPVQEEPMDPRGVQATWDWPTTTEAYLGYADRYRGELARTLTAIGGADAPVAVHCAGGRDRTGIACGMALWLAGVEPDTIAADHASSDEYLGPFNAEWVEQAPDEEERKRRQRITGPLGRSLAEVLEEIEQREGIRNLLVGAGADEAALDRLAARLRGAAS